MKIFHFTPSLSIGGTETFVVDLAIEQRKQGYDVQVIVLDHAKDIFKSVEVENKNKKKLSESGVGITFSGQKGRYSFISIYFLIRGLYIKEENVLHLHFYFFAIFLIFMKGKAKVIFTQHTRCLRYPYFHKLFISRVIDQYIGISSDCYQSIINIINPLKTKCINNGVSIEPSVYLDNSFKKNEELKLIYVGRLDVNKNVHSLIDVLSEVLKSGLSNWTLNIVGEGPKFDELKQQIIRLDLGGYIKMLGARSDVPSLLRGSDIFLFPSKVEGFSIALIEALFSNVVIVSSDASGNKDILSDGSYGYIFNKDDSSELNKILIQLFKFGHADNRNVKDLVNHTKSLSIEVCSTNYISTYKGLFNEASN